MVAEIVVEMAAMVMVEQPVTLRAEAVRQKVITLSLQVLPLAKERAVGEAIRGVKKVLRKAVPVKLYQYFILQGVRCYRILCSIY